MRKCIRDAGRSLKPAPGDRGESRFVRRKLGCGRGYLQGLFAICSNCAAPGALSAPQLDFSLLHVQQCRQEAPYSICNHDELFIEHNLRHVELAYIRHNDLALPTRSKQRKEERVLACGGSLPTRRPPRRPRDNPLSRHGRLHSPTSRTEQSVRREVQAEGFRRSSVTGETLLRTPRRFGALKPPLSTRPI